MRLYTIKTPKLVKRLFPRLVWEFPITTKTIYLTFDDGPTPEITPWVLQELKKYNAKATFFCIGKNIEAHPEIFQNIIAGGHSIGNHTQHHENAWKVSAKIYLENIEATQKLLPNTTKLFRPPYGKLTPKVCKNILKAGYKIIMWNVLSGDFDTTLSKEKCLKNVKENTTPGSIIVFHDSLKASKKVKYVLPEILAHFSKEGYNFEKITT